MMRVRHFSITPAKVGLGVVRGSAFRHSSTCKKNERGQRRTGVKMEQADYSQELSIHRMSMREQVGRLGGQNKNGSSNNDSNSIK